MNFFNRKKAAVCAVLMGLIVLLSACGYERIGISKLQGETGEFYSSGTADTAPEPGAKSPTAPAADPLTDVQKEFEEFCRTVFCEEMSETSTLDIHYTLLHPEAYGIEAKEASLGSYNLTEMIKNNDSIRDLKARLMAFDRGLLTDAQTLVYDTLLTILDTSLMAEGLELYEQPLAPTISVQAQLPILLAEYSFHSLTDVENYLALLSQIDSYYGQILAFENQKADAGLGPSDASIDQILISCESYLIDPENNFLTETFATRLDALSKTAALTDEQRADLDARHRAAIKEHFIPAYESLISGISALKGRGLNESGLSGFKDGKRYYEYLVKSGPGVSYSVPELKAALSRQMEKDYEAIGKILSENPSLDLKQASFSLSDPEEILADLKSQMSSDFPVLSECGYEIRYVPSYLESSLSPAFYLTAPLDDVNQNVIYINNGFSDSTDSLYTTLAHEGFPGHLYQTVYNRTHAVSPLMSILSCSGANEGWATYVENYACTFDNGLPKAVGEYRAHIRSFSLCVHGLLDIGINYDNWTKEQAKEFITACFQVDDDTVDELWQVMIDNPANYLEYCGGYVEYMEIRELAEAALGKDFSPMEFHTLLLDLGPIPFSVTREFVSQWISQKAA